MAHSRAISLSPYCHILCPPYSSQVIGDSGRPIDFLNVFIKHIPPEFTEDGEGGSLGRQCRIILYHSSQPPKSSNGSNCLDLKLYFKEFGEIVRGFSVLTIIRKMFTWQVRGFLTPQVSAKIMTTSNSSSSMGYGYAAVANFWSFDLLFSWPLTSSSPQICPLRGRGISNRSHRNYGRFPNRRPQVGSGEWQT